MASDTDTATPEPGRRFGLQGLRARIAAALPPRVLDALDRSDHVVQLHASRAVVPGALWLCWSSDCKPVDSVTLDVPAAR